MQLTWQQTEVHVALPLVCRKRSDLKFRCNMERHFTNLILPTSTSIKKRLSLQEIHKTLRSMVYYLPHSFLTVFLLSHKNLKRSCTKNKRSTWTNNFIRERRFPKIKSSFARVTWELAPPGLTACSRHNYLTRLNIFRAFRMHHIPLSCLSGAEWTKK